MPYEKGGVDVVDTGEWPVNRVSLEPAWRWTEHIKPVVGTNLCETFHVKLIAHGRFGVRMREALEVEFGMGEWGHRSGHVAWVVCEETCAFIDLARVVRGASGQA